MPAISSAFLDLPATGVGVGALVIAAARRKSWRGRLRAWCRRGDHLRWRRRTWLGTRDRPRFGPRFGTRLMLRPWLRTREARRRIGRHDRSRLLLLLLHLLHLLHLLRAFG